MGRFISAAVLREMAKKDKDIFLEEDSVLTPSAKDLAKELGITITKGRQEIISKSVIAQSVGQTPNHPNERHVACEIIGTETQNDDLKKTVQKILSEVLKPACENPKATHVLGKSVVIQPFSEAPPGQKIGMIDVIDARVGNLASGFMTFDHSRLPWLLNYDEVDYIVEGEFVLEIDGKVFRAVAGDVIYIPKGSPVVFSSPTFCKVFYVTYPANWTDLAD
jgi:ethanolamine utilization protein EutQ